MSNNVAALAALAAASTAFAQSTVTISGGIQTGIMDTGLVGAKAGVGQLGNGANAINIASTEDLGGGLKGGFTGQIRYNAINGDVNSSGQGNALFHAANAFISGGFGTVRVGKIAEASNCGYDVWGCGGGAGMMGGATNTLAATVGASTQSSSVSYATPTINGFSAGFQTTVSTRANERQILNLSYTQGPLSALYLNAKNGAAAAANGTLGAAVTAAFDATASDTKSDATYIGASYDFGVARLNAGNTVTKDAAGAKTADMISISASMPMGAYTLLAGVNKAKHIGAVNATNDTKMAVGANYALSKRTTLGADLFKQEVTGGSTGFVVRVAHTF